METNNQETSTGLDTSTHRVFGVPRRAIAFGFGLFVMLVVLAVVYSQFAAPEAMPQQKAMPGSMNAPAEQGDYGVKINEMVTPDRAMADLIDEAMAEREESMKYEQDEIADVEDGSNY